MSEVAGGTIQGDKPTSVSPEEGILSSPRLPDETIPWLNYAVEQAQIAQKTIEISLENAISVTRSRVDRILTTSSAHFNQTIDSLQDLKSAYIAYEDIAFGKLKEGFLVASAHPWITTGTGLGIGVLGLKRTRRFMYYNSLRLFSSEETLLSRADTKVKELQKSVDLLKAESDKLEKNALRAEENLWRGRTKLKQVGKQIQSVVNSAYKIERQAIGLNDALRELPSREASRFRTQVTNLTKEAKQERSALSKEVTKINNYGISV